jgi:ADP-ribose pyrophosphatase YjhB (NUDIX family)
MNANGSSCIVRPPGPTTRANGSGRRPAERARAIEPLEDCARRELLEETRLDLRLEPTDLGDDSWVVFTAQAPPDGEVRLDAEHDKLEWLDAETTAARCLPARVGDTFLRLAGAGPYERAARWRPATRS